MTRVHHDIKTAPSSLEVTEPDKSGVALSDLLHAGLSVPSPFMREIFLVRQAIVGTRYLGGSDELVHDLKPGSRVTFVAEPDNPYDENAVMALDSQGRKLGYIPRHENSIIGALLKAGKSIYGIIPEEQPRGATVNRKTPFSLWVDLYMKEFLLPDDLCSIPRQGYRGSYAVVGMKISKYQDEYETRAVIEKIFAVKYINGEERDIFSGRISGYDIEDRKKLLHRFQKFTGYLPIVGHELDNVMPVLSEDYGVLLGMPFSNRVIDTKIMALNHLPGEKDYSLDSLAKELGIKVSSGSRLERRCRKTWELYCRMERSELEKTK